MKSNQSFPVMPTAPPKIHFILPHKCGSGKNGANPSVAKSSRGINKSFRLDMAIIYARRYSLLLTQ